MARACWPAKRLAHNAAQDQPPHTIMSGYADPGFDTLALHAGAAPDPATGARAVPIVLSTSFVFENSKAVAPAATAKPARADASARASSPRQACAGKERYALLQCMNEQCAKSTWTKHEQCVRLRRERKL